MPKEPSDQRSYSVDEMMERLREGEREKRRSEDSELVTRPDGSQVVRVRRRKRRTSQPKVTKLVRKKRFGVIALVFLTVVTVVLGAMVLVLLARFNSKGYRESLKERVLASTGAKVGISDLVVTPTKARAKSVQMAWPTGGYAKTLKLEDLSAKLEPTSFLGSEWKGEEILAGAGVLILGPPDGTIMASVRDGKFPFDYNSYRCSNFEIVFGDNLAEPALRVSSAELTLRAMKGGGLQFLLNGGNASFGPWNELKIDRGLAELKDGRFKLDSLRAQVEPEGQLTVKTTKPVVEGSLAILELSLKSYPLDHLLDAAHGFGRMISGTIDAPSASITADPRHLDSGKVRVQFTGKDASLQRFKFLSPLSSVLNKIYYANPNLGKVEGIFRQDKDGVRIDKFKFEAKTQLIIQGDLAANSAGELSGSLRVGVPEVLVMHNETEKRHGHEAFSDPEAGYCWIDLKLSGTLDAPYDNFFEVLRQAGTKKGPRNSPPNALPRTDPDPGLTPLDPTPVPEPENPLPEGDSILPPGAPPSPQPAPRSEEERLEDAFERLTK